MTHARTLWVPITCWAIACGTPGDPQTNDSDGPTDASDCDDGVTATTPSDGAMGVFYDDAIEVTFGEDASTTASLALTTDGTTVPGATTFSTDGLTATFTPDVPLESTTTYDLTITHGCPVDRTVTFTTSDAGTPVALDAVDGKVFELDLANAAWTLPESVDAWTVPIFTDNHLRILATRTEDDTLAMRGGVFREDDEGNWVQDLCIPTIDLGTANVDDNPFVGIQKINSAWTLGGTTIELASFVLESHLTQDAEAMERPFFQLFVDLSRIEAGVDLGEGDGSLCSYVGTLGIDCHACGDGRDVCLKIEASAFDVSHVGGTVVERTDAAIDSDATCGEG